MGVLTVKKKRKFNMPPKKKTVEVKETPTAPTVQNVVKEALLKEYWTLIKEENIGHTPEITLKVDALQAEIKKL